MPHGTWARPRDTGYGLMDYDHFRQLHLVSAARDALTWGGDLANAGEILDALVQSTLLHSLSENLLMRLYRYPWHERHVAEHDEMDQCIQASLDAYRVGDVDAALDLLKRYSDWLEAHIAEEDAALDRYLETCRSKPRRMAKTHRNLKRELLEGGIDRPSGRLAGSQRAASVEAPQQRPGVLGRLLGEGSRTVR